MDKAAWIKYGEQRGWGFRPEGLFWRLPVIRHIRALWHGIQLKRHNALYTSMGLIATGHDEWMLQGVWRGYV